MASQIIDFLQSTFELPYIAILVFVIIVVTDLFYDFKFCKIGYSYMKDEIKQLKQENERLKGVLSSYESNDN